MYVNQEIFLREDVIIKLFSTSINCLEIDCTNFRIFVKTKILINRNHFHYDISVRKIN